MNEAHVRITQLKRKNGGFARELTDMYDVHLVNASGEEWPGVDYPLACPDDASRIASKWAKFLGWPLKKSKIVETCAGELVYDDE